MIAETWYLLYDGQSADGRGNSDYLGRTTDHAVAVAHASNCAKNPYSTGYVNAVNDKDEWRISATATESKT